MKDTNVKSEVRVAELSEFGKQNISLKPEIESKAMELFGLDMALQATYNFDQAFNSSPVCMLVIDEASAIVKANKAALLLLGGAEVAILDQPIGAILSCVHRSINPRNFEKGCTICDFHLGLEAILAKGGSMQQSELPIVLYHKGEYRKVWLEINAWDLKLNQHRHLCMTLMDISRFKQAEKTMQERHSMFDIAMDASKMAWWALDVKTGNVTFNRRKAEMLGYPPEKFKHYTDFTALVHPEDRDRVMVAMRDHFNGKADKYKVEYRMLTNSGNYKWNYDIGSIVKRDTKGNPLSVIGVVMDTTERKGTEEKLKESEARFKNMFERNSSVMVLVDPDTKKVIDANFAASRFYGYTTQELCSMSLSDLSPLSFDEANELIIPIGSECQNGFITTQRLAGGELAQVEIHVSIIYYGDKNIHFLIVRDITKRVKAEQALRESEARYQLIADYSPDWEVFRDKHGKLIYSSIAFEALTGYKNEDYLSGKIQMRDFIHHDDLDNTLERFHDALKGKKISAYEYRIITRDGLTKHVVIASQAVNVDNNRFAGIRTSIKDISEIRYAEQALKESEEKFSKAFHSNSALMAISHLKSGVFIDVNDAFLNTLGYTRDEVIGKTRKELSLFVNPDTREIADQVKDHLRPGNGIEAEVLTRNGEHKTGLFSVEHISIGQEICLLTTMVDITFRKEAELIKKKNEELVIAKEKAELSERITKEFSLELIKAKEKAEESDKLKTAFLSNMSHEIRTPMNGILGFSELLLTPGLTGEQQEEYIEVIKKSGNRMLNIINDIVAISKIESGLVSVTDSQTSVNQQTEFVYRLFVSQAKDKEIAFTCKNGLAAASDLIITDKEKLVVVLTNLVKNAIKFCETGSVEFGYYLKTKADGTESAMNVHINTGWLEFYVKDTGIGISSNRQQAIFDRFVQADIQDSRAYQGAGLGLSISKAYVEMLGGKIWVESEEGKGSVFYFTIPFNTVLKENPGIGIPTSMDEVVAQNKKLKILIAEDDETSTMLIRIMVSIYSHVILEATTGVDAIQICRSNPDIDLILMDIKMPLMDGYEAAREIRKFNKKVFIVAQTAFAIRGDREKALAAGCNEYLEKPIDVLKLRSVIEKHFTT